MSSQKERYLEMNEIQHPFPRPIRQMASLSQLKLDYVNLFLIHTSLGFNDEKLLWTESKQVKKQGLAKNAGARVFKAPSDLG